MNFKNIIFLVTGIAGGAVTTYLIAKEKFENELTQETENIKKYYETKYQEKLEFLEDKNVVKEEAEVEEKSNDIPKRDVKVNATQVEPDYEAIIDKLNYNQFSTTPKTETQPKKSKQKAKRPYVISEDEYNEDMKQIKKIVSFFEEDEVLYDNDEKEVIDNVGKDIGFDCLELINMNDTGEIYVRNEMLGIDYDIVSEPGSYEDFLGDQ